MKRIGFIALLCLLFVNAMAQNQDKWIIKASVGGVVARSNIKPANTIHDFVAANINDGGEGVAHLQVGRSIYKWIGLVLNANLSMSKIGGYPGVLFQDGNYDTYKYDFNSEYPNQIVKSKVLDFSDYGGRLNQYYTSLYGIISVVKKLQLKPSVGIGISTLTLPSESFLVKDPKSNYAQEVNYRGKKSIYPTFFGGMAMEYSFFKNFGVALNYTFTNSKASIEYQLDKSDIYGNTTNERIKKKMQIQPQYFTVGFFVKLQQYARSHSH